MRYDNPEMRELLAAEYLLGTMPRRARARFEQLMRQDPALATLVSDWARRFSAIDRATPAEAPPARVWRRIEARIAPRSASDVAIAAPPLQSLRAALQFWRGLAITASAVAVALIVYLATVRGPVVPQAPQVIAVLADQNGEPEWIATAGPRSGEIAIAALRPQHAGTDRSFELWRIAGGTPRPLGLLRPQTEQSTVFSPKDLPAAGDVLAVSLEPPGGSPTGLPTGPVVSQGKVIRPL
jgi:anti-sigma-K factor RskA